MTRDQIDHGGLFSFWPPEGIVFFFVPIVCIEDYYFWGVFINLINSGDKIIVEAIMHLGRCCQMEHFINCSRSRLQRKQVEVERGGGEVGDNGGGGRV